MSQPPESNRGEKVTIVVPFTGVPPTAVSDEEVQEQGLPGAVVRAVKGAFTQTTEVDADKLAAGLAAIRSQVERLLTTVSTGTIGAMQLSEVEIALSVTAEGGIGIATVGAEASIALVYSHRESAA